jgi:hypothetical protein
VEIAFYTSIEIYVKWGESKLNQLEPFSPSFGLSGNGVTISALTPTRTSVLASLK